MSEGQVVIRSLRRNDFVDWLPLWEANQGGLIERSLTNDTWKKLTTKSSPIYGLGIWENGKLIGILHFILHPMTGHKGDVCYMQDLFIKTEKRRNGHAKCLLNKLFQQAETENWRWVYWFAMRDNKEAELLYKNVGVKMEMNIHMMMPGVSA